MNFVELKPVAAKPATPRQLSDLAREIAAKPVARAISPIVLAGIVRAAELVGIAAIGIAAYWGLVYRKEGFAWPYAAALALVPLAAVIAFQVVELYSAAAFRSHIQQLARVVLAWTLVFLVALAVVFFGKLDGTFSRLWAATWFSGGLAALLIGRSVLTALVRRWARHGRLIRHIAIVGGGREGESLLHALDGEADSDMRICGIFDDRGGERSPPMVAGVAKLGTVDDLIQFTRLTRVDLILVAMPLTAEERVLEMVRKLWVLPVDVRLAAHMNRLRFRPRAYSYIGSVPVLDIFDTPIADWDMAMKTLFDRLIGALLLVLLSPVMAAAALAIKLDSPGPILFRQRRHGFNNEEIEVFKFRSLHHRHSDPLARRVVTRNDPRVTRVGTIHPQDLD